MIHSHEFLSNSRMTIKYSNPIFLQMMVIELKQWQSNKNIHTLAIG